MVVGRRNEFREVLFMFCKNCGEKIPEGSAFCSVCGAKQNIEEARINNQVDNSNSNIHELTDEEKYQNDLKNTKKRLVIIGAIIAFIGVGVYSVNASIEAGPEVKFGTKISAMLGDANAEYRIGASLNGAEKVKWLEKAATHGHADAQAELGYCYYSGNGVVKDFKKALEWFQKAAGNGSVYGQFRMGWAYSQGEGVDKDLKLAVSWYRKAADNGNAAAMNNLAVCYDRGEGVPRDLNEAFKLYDKASAKGNLLATINLARMYEQGKGTAQDKKKAFELFHQVASNKDVFSSEEYKENIANAMYNVGRMYFWGIGIEKNQKEAVKYLELAKDKGNIDSLYVLGVAYYIGQGVPVDALKGKSLIKEAASKGHAKAKEVLNIL